MFLHRYVGLSVTLALLFAADAGAQSPVVTLVPANWARWDVSGHAGRQGVHRPGFSSEWDYWYEAATYGVTAGRFLTTNIRLELDVARSAVADGYVAETVAQGGTSFYRTQQHHFTTTAASAGAAYQAFENRWVHPFIGGGVEIMHETRRTDPSTQYLSFRDGLPVPLPGNAGLPASVAHSVTARPFAITGLKVYVAPGAFLRTDVRVSLSRAGAASAVWRAGVGVDF